MTDTTVAVMEKINSLYANLSYGERLQKYSSLFSSAKRIIRAAIKTNNPNLYDIDLDLAVFKQIYKNELSEEYLTSFEQHLRKIRSIH